MAGKEDKQRRVAKIVGGDYCQTLKVVMLTEYCEAARLGLGNASHVMYSVQIIGLNIGLPSV